MSFPGGRPERDQDRSVDDDSPAPVDPTEPPERGLLGRLRRHVREWPGRYVEMRVEARTGRSK